MKKLATAVQLIRWLVYNVSYIVENSSHIISTGLIADNSWCHVAGIRHSKPTCQSKQ